MVQEKYVMWSVRVLVWAAIIGVAWCLLGCVHERPTKLYIHDADRRLFIRNLENKDVLTYEQADGLICQSPEDMKKSVVDRENLKNKNKGKK